MASQFHRHQAHSSRFGSAVSRSELGSTMRSRCSAGLGAGKGASPAAPTHAGGWAARFPAVPWHHAARCDSARPASRPPAAAICGRCTLLRCMARPAQPPPHHHQRFFISFCPAGHACWALLLGGVGSDQRVAVQVGVDINAAATLPWRAHVVPFVAGLGPRKARALLQVHPPPPAPPFSFVSLSRGAVVQMGVTLSSG